jgi:hypothetical protein
MPSAFNRLGYNSLPFRAKYWGCGGFVPPYTQRFLGEIFNTPPFMAGMLYYPGGNVLPVGKKLENGYDGTKVFRERSRKINKGKLKKAVQENPEAYLYELAQRFDCTPQAVFLMLGKLKTTRKKNPSLILKNQKKNARNI